MTSMLSRSSNKPRDRRGSKSDSRQRSSSMSDVYRGRNKTRLPAIDFRDIDDTATAICVEVARATLKEPSMHTGVFFKTASNSRRDIAMSDTVIVLSAAILEHLKNPRMAKEVLNKSATCSEYFKKLNLHTEDVREMFVTMLFSVHPNLVTMIEKALSIAIKRSADLRKTEYDDKQLERSFKQLLIHDSVNTDELTDAMSDITGASQVSVQRRNSIQRTPTELISPADSASVVARPRISRSSVTQADLMEYVNRRKRGPEPEFESVFPTASRPITTLPKRDRTGLGYTTEMRADTRMEESRAAAMDAILGSARVPSYVLRSGDVRNRRPRVEDFLDSESISPSAMEPVPTVEEVSWARVTPDVRRAPSPTEAYLPDSIVESSEISGTTLKRMDSYELLMASLSAN